MATSALLMTEADRGPTADIVVLGLVPGVLLAALAHEDKDRALPLPTGPPDSLELIGLSTGGGACQRDGEAAVWS
jgi:hypothetical protein